MPRDSAKGPTWFNIYIDSMLIEWRAPNKFQGIANTQSDTKQLISANLERWACNEKIKLSRD